MLTIPTGDLTETPTPAERAGALCLRLLDTVWADLPVQVQTGPAKERASQNSAALRPDQHGYLRWFVRVVPHIDWAAVIPLGRPEQLGHARLRNPEWVRYPDAWDTPGEQEFTDRLMDEVSTALHVIDKEKIREKDANDAGLLPGTDVNVRRPKHPLNRVARHRADDRQYPDPTPLVHPTARQDPAALTPTD